MMQQFTIVTVIVIIIIISLAIQSVSCSSLLEDDLELPELPYSVDALEPVIDTKTMQVHHGAHHRAYTNNLNAALREMRENECECLLSLYLSPFLRISLCSHAVVYLNAATL